MAYDATHQAGHRPGITRPGDAGHSARVLDQTLALVFCHDISDKVTQTFPGSVAADIGKMGIPHSSLHNLPTDGGRMGDHAQAIRSTL